MKLFRNQASVLMILFNHSTPVNANIIASLINTSLKTVKKEIDDLNDVCLQNGCEIISYPGSGYQMEVYDRNKYELFADNIRGMYNRDYFYSDAQQERVSFIVRLFLVRRNLTINELIDACFCSESSIRRDLKSVSEVFEEYGLTLVNQNKKGITLIGDEWHIRMAFMHERYNLLFKIKVFITDESYEFNRMFLESRDLFEKLQDTIVSVLARYKYKLSYDAQMRFTAMVALSISRNNFSEFLNVTEEMNQHDITLEENIIEDIYKEFPYTNSNILTENDTRFLSLYLKSVRLIRYNELLFMEEKQKIETIANGFIDHIKSFFDIGTSDTFVLFKDLCSFTFKIYYSSLIDAHSIKSTTYQQTKDGLFNLDLCSMLYRYYTEECNLNCYPYDVLPFYHAFVNFSDSNADQISKKIYVVADAGFFTARSQARLINKRNTNLYVTYTPFEYGDLNTIDPAGYDGIVTDIPNLPDTYRNKPVLNLQYFRVNSYVESMSRFFLFNDSNLREIFKPEDLFYADGINCEDDIIEFVRRNVFHNNNEADDFISESKSIAEIYERSRNNNYYIFSSLKDHFGYSFIKIICLKEAIKLKNSYVNKILIFNVKGNNFQTRNMASSIVGLLIHDNDTLISFDREKDYQLLFSILSGK